MGSPYKRARLIIASNCVVGSVGPGFLGFPVRADRTDRIHLVFQSNDVEVDRRRDVDADPLAAHETVLDRRYIDVGFGAPSAHR